MATLRTQQLQDLRNKLPVMNQRIVTGLQEGQMARLQSQLVPPGSGVTRAPSVVAAAGAQLATQQGETALRGQQQAAQQNIQIAGQQVNEQVRAGAERLGDLETGAREETRRLTERLANMDTSLKSKLVDEQMQFARDKAGNVLFNTRQLMDWNAANARTVEEFRNRAQVVEQAGQRKIAILERANQLLKQTIEQGYLKNKQVMDQDLKKKLVQKQQAVEMKIKREQAQAASRAMIGQGLGTVAGMAIGAAVGPVGAVAGGQVGGFAGILGASAVPK